MAPSSAGPGRWRRYENRTGSNLTGEHSSSTAWWNDVPRGTMDEVSSYVRLDLPSLDGKAARKIVHLVFESYGGRALVPSPKRSASPRATSTLQWRIGLKALDPERPIREADIGGSQSVGTLSAPCRGLISKRGCVERVKLGRCQPRTATARLPLHRPRQLPVPAYQARASPFLTDIACYDRRSECRRRVQCIASC
jgi:hypothetical protein